MDSYLQVHPTAEEINAQALQCLMWGDYEVEERKTQAVQSVCRNSFWKGLFPCPVAGSHPAHSCPGNDDFSLPQLSRVLTVSVSHWNKTKKILLDCFHQNGNIWLEYKNSGCVLSAVHISLLLVLMCKGIKCNYWEAGVSPGHCGTDLQNPCHVHVPACTLSSLPACFPEQL